MGQTATDNEWTRHPPTPAPYVPKKFTRADIVAGLAKVRKQSAGPQDNLMQSRATASQAIESINRAESFDEGTVYYDSTAAEKMAEDYKAAAAPKKLSKEEKLVKKAEDKKVHDAILALRQKSAHPAAPQYKESRVEAAAMLEDLNKMSEEEAKQATATTTVPTEAQVPVEAPHKSKPTSELSDSTLEAYLSQLRVHNRKIQKSHGTNGAKRVDQSNKARFSANYFFQ